MITFLQDLIILIAIIGLIDILFNNKKGKINE
jgi:hypothetical protein